MSEIVPYSKMMFEDLLIFITLVRKNNNCVYIEAISYFQHISPVFWTERKSVESIAFAQLSVCQDSYGHCLHSPSWTCRSC